MEAKFCVRRGFIASCHNYGRKHAGERLSKKLSRCGRHLFIYTWEKVVLLLRHLQQVRQEDHFLSFQSRRQNRFKGHCFRRCERETVKMVVSAKAGKSGEQETWRLVPVLVIMGHSMGMERSGRCFVLKSFLMVSPLQPPQP